MSDELKAAALSLLLDEANQKPLPQVMQDVALEWLAERDQTPVDAAWLDEVLSVDEKEREQWKWIVQEIAMPLTRGDVLTALRLLGGKRK